MRCDFQSMPPVRRFAAHFPAVLGVFLGSLLLSAAPVHADAIMFISNFGAGGSGDTNSLLSYNTSTHALAVIDSAVGTTGSFIAPDPSNPANSDLFSIRDNVSAGTSAIYTHSFDPTTGAVGSATTFLSPISGQSRGMAYAPLTNTIYATTFTPTTHINAVIDTTPASYTPLSDSGGGPYGIVIDAAGTLWVVGGGNLYTYNPVTQTATGKYTDSSTLLIRDAIAPASFAGGAFTGDIFFTDFSHNRVDYYDPSTGEHPLTNLGTNLLSNPGGIGFDPITGTLYVTNVGSNTVVSYNTVAQTFNYATGLAPGNGILHGPSDLSFGVVPEPASLTLLALGCVVAIRRRRAA